MVGDGCTRFALLHEGQDAVAAQWVDDLLGRHTSVSILDEAASSALLAAGGSAGVIVSGSARGSARAVLAREAGPRRLEALTAGWSPPPCAHGIRVDTRALYEVANAETHLRRWLSAGGSGGGVVLELSWREAALGALHALRHAASLPPRSLGGPPLRTHSAALQSELERLTRSAEARRALALRLISSGEMRGGRVAGRAGGRAEQIQAVHVEGDTSPTHTHSSHMSHFPFFLYLNVCF